MNVFLGLPASANPPPPPSKKKRLESFHGDSPDAIQTSEKYLKFSTMLGMGILVMLVMQSMGFSMKIVCLTPSGKINTIRSNNPKPITMNHSHQPKHCTKLTLSIFITVFLCKPLLYNILGGLYKQNIDEISHL